MTTVADLAIASPVWVDRLVERQEDGTFRASGLYQLVPWLRTGMVACSPHVPCCLRAAAMAAQTSLQRYSLEIFSALRVYCEPRTRARVRGWEHGIIPPRAPVQPLPASHVHISGELSLSIPSSLRVALLGQQAKH